MSEKIKVGVVGSGALGFHHARLYQQCENAELVGVYDARQETAADVASRLGTAVFESEDALADKVDALSVAVPTHLHYQVSKRLLARGLHLLIEKPITRTVDEGRELLELAKNQKVVLAVGHVERFNPVISFLEEKLDNPRFIESHRLAPFPPPRPGLPPRGTEVGVVLDLMIHDLDMILNLVPSEVESVDAVGIPILSPFEDIANARIRFKNGCVANLTTSRVTPEPMRKIRVFQNNAYLSLDYQEKSGQVYVKEGSTIARHDVPVEDHNALLVQLQHFLECIEKARSGEGIPTPKVSGEHGLAALALAVQISDLIESSKGM